MRVIILIFFDKIIINLLIYTHSTIYSLPYSITQVTSRWKLHRRIRFGRQKFWKFTFLDPTRTIFKSIRDTLLFNLLLFRLFDLRVISFFTISSRSLNLHRTKCVNSFSKHIGSAYLTQFSRYFVVLFVALSLYHKLIELIQLCFSILNNGRRKLPCNRARRWRFVWESVQREAEVYRTGTFGFHWKWFFFKLFIFHL